jgi:PAS domain S-box-containing protein
MIIRRVIQMRLGSLMVLILVLFAIIPAMAIGIFTYKQGYNKLYDAAKQDLGERMDFCLATCEFYNEKVEKGLLTKEEAINEITTLLCGPKLPNDTRDITKGLGKGKTGYVDARYSNYTLAFQPYWSGSIYDIPDPKLREAEEIATKTTSREWLIYKWYNLGEEKYYLKVTVLDYFKPFDLHLAVPATMDEFTAPIFAIRNTIITAVLLVGVIAIAFSLFTGDKIAKPFTKLSETSSKIIKGDLTARVDTKTPIEEFSSVSKDINQMVDSLITTQIREKTIIDNALDLIVLLDDKHRWLRVNPAWEEFTGFKVEELQGNTTEDQPCVTPETLKALVHDREKLAKGEIVPLFDLPFKHKDGRKILVSATERPLKDAKGKWIGSVWTGRDVTELRKREAELKQAKLFSDLTINTSAVPIIVTDRDWKWIKVNPAFEKLFGYKAEEVLGKSRRELPIWTPEEYKKAEDTATQLIEKEGVVKHIEFETLCKTKDGRVLNILVSEIFLEEKVSKEIGFISYDFDITKLRKREEEVKEARAYVEAIIANIADPLWVVDKYDNWILVNEAMEKVTGYKKEEVLEKNMLTHPLFSPFISMLDGKEKLKAMIEKIKAGEHVPNIFIPWLTKDKGMLMMSCSGEPLRDAEGNVIGGVFIGRDMSVLQSTGVSATRTLAREVEGEVGRNYKLATLLFMSNASIIVGDSSLEILRGTVEGYNRRFNKNIGIKEGIALTNMPKEEWPSFLEFLLSRFFECIGPTTFECSEGIESVEEIVEKVKAKYEGKEA